MGLLQTNEALLAKLVRDSPIAVVVSTQPDDRLLDVNDSFLRLSGYTRDEIIGQTSGDLDLWVNAAQRKVLISRLADEQCLREYEATVRTKTGDERQILASVEQIKIEERVYLLTQMYCVTARTAAEEEFPTREERFRAFDHAAMGMALFTGTSTATSSSNFSAERSRATRPKSVWCAGQMR
jgi:PAS domain S-box-containing protein